MHPERLYWLACWPLLALWCLFYALSDSTPWKIIALIFILKNVLVLYYGRDWRNRAR